MLSVDFTFFATRAPKILGDHLMVKLKSQTTLLSFSRDLKLSLSKKKLKEMKELVQYSRDGRHTVRINDAIGLKIPLYSISKGRVFSG